jgi:hypothetical protein
MPSGQAVSTREDSRPCLPTKINKHRRRQALGGGVDLQGGGDGGRYIPTAAGPKGCARSAVKTGPKRIHRSSLDFGNL